MMIMLIVAYDQNYKQREIKKECLSNVFILIGWQTS